MWPCTRHFPAAVADPKGLSVALTPQGWITASFLEGEPGWHISVSALGRDVRTVLWYPQLLSYYLLLIPLQILLGVQGWGAANLPSAWHEAFEAQWRGRAEQCSLLNEVSSRHGASASVISWHSAQSPGPLASPRTRNLDHFLPTQCWVRLLVQFKSLRI